MYKILDHIHNNSIIFLKINTDKNIYILDILKLLNNYCGIYLFSETYFEEIDNISVTLILHNFKDIPNLKNNLKKVIDLDIKSLNEGFYDGEFNHDLIEKYIEITKFNVKKFLKFYKIVGENKVSEEIKNQIVDFNSNIILKDNIMVKPNQIPWLNNIINNKIIKIDNNNYKFTNTELNFFEAQYIYNLIYNNKLTEILEINMAYGISSIYITLALKRLNIIDKFKKGTLISIDDEQFSKYKGIGLKNIKKAHTIDYHTFYLKKPIKYYHNYLKIIMKAILI